MKARKARCGIEFGPGVASTPLDVLGLLAADDDVVVRIGGMTGGSPDTGTPAVKDAPRRYTTWGLTDGGCGHVHHSVDTAEACRHRHDHHARRLGNAIDRDVYRLDDEGHRLDITEVEAARLADLTSARFEGRRR